MFGTNPTKLGDRPDLSRNIAFNVPGADFPGAGHNTTGKSRLVVLPFQTSTHPEVDIHTSTHNRLKAGDLVLTLVSGPGNEKLSNRKSKSRGNCPPSYKSAGTTSMGGAPAIVGVACLNHLLRKESEQTRKDVESGKLKIPEGMLPWYESVQAVNDWAMVTGMVSDKDLVGSTAQASGEVVRANTLSVAVMGRCDANDGPSSVTRAAGMANKLSSSTGSELYVQFSRELYAPTPDTKPYSLVVVSIVVVDSPKARAALHCKLDGELSVAELVERREPVTVESKGNDIYGLSADSVDKWKKNPLRCSDERILVKYAILQKSLAGVMYPNDVAMRNCLEGGLSNKRVKMYVAMSR